MTTSQSGGRRTPTWIRGWGADPSRSRQAATPPVNSSIDHPLLAGNYHCDREVRRREHRRWAAV